MALTMNKILLKIFGAMSKEMYSKCIRNLYPRVERCLELVSVDIVDGYKLLFRDTCIRLHVSGVNAALAINGLHSNVNC